MMFRFSPSKATSRPSSLTLPSASICPRSRSKLACCILRFSTSLIESSDRSMGVTPSFSNSRITTLPLRSPDVGWPTVPIMPVRVSLVGVMKVPSSALIWTTVLLGLRWMRAMGLITSMTPWLLGVSDSPSRSYCTPWLSLK